MADSTESEAEAESEMNDENEAQMSLSTTSKSSCGKFTGAARYKSTFQNEWTVKYKTFLCQVHDNIHAFYCNVCKKEVSMKHQGESLRNQPILNLATSSQAWIYRGGGGGGGGGGCTPLLALVNKVCNGAAKNQIQKCDIISKVFPFLKSN
jgi:hypothetical protein